MGFSSACQAKAQAKVVEDVDSIAAWTSNLIFQVKTTKNKSNRVLRVLSGALILERDVAVLKCASTISVFLYRGLFWRERKSRRDAMGLL